ncbi:unnamed protein product, partial [Ceratitis capitata]
RSRNETINSTFAINYEKTAGSNHKKKTAPKKSKHRSPIQRPKSLSFFTTLSHRQPRLALIIKPVIYGGCRRAKQNQPLPNRSGQGSNANFLTKTNTSTQPRALPKKTYGEKDYAGNFVKLIDDTINISKLCLLTIENFEATESKTDITYHIDTKSPPVFSKPRPLLPEKLKAAKAEIQ